MLVVVFCDRKFYLRDFFQTYVVHTDRIENVYLYQRDRIFCKNLETGEQEILAWLPKSLTYTFDRWEDQLIVINHETNEVVEVLDEDL